MTDTMHTRARPTSREAPGLRLYLMVGALYFTQGIPLGLAMEALPAMLRRQGASLEALAFLPLVGLPWIAKFLWASRIDRHYSERLGRRRSWIVPMQLLVLASLLSVAVLGMSGASGPFVIALALAGSLASATQDIATDGLTAERFGGAALARANALQVGGTMMGFFLGGSGSLILMDRLGQHLALLVPAAVVALGLLLVLCWREPAQSVPEETAGARRPGLRNFIARPGAGVLLGLAFLSSLTAVSGFGLSKLLLVDAGWSMKRIGEVGIGGGMVTVVLGCGGGAWLARRLDVQRILQLGLVCSALAAALWMHLALAGDGMAGDEVWLATLLGCFGAGSASVAVMTLAMRFAARGDQAGTDMTAVQSTRDLGEVLTSSLLTGLAVHLGYGGSFLLGCGCALLTLLLAMMHVFREKGAPATNPVS